MKLAAKELRVSEPTKAQLAKIKRREIYIVCDNVLDTYNIGSIFRLADAIGAKCIYLCGDSETPPNPRIAKASIGTDKWVEWEYASTAVEAIVKLKNQNSKIKVVAIEQDKKAVDFRKIDYSEPIAFVVGHETFGCSKETLNACDVIAEIPMYGINVSLNVMVSLGIVLFRAI
ncbi:MAG TPA: TrmH family RNA methyltransferase [Candidatus Saccharimonadales bacterium]|nr:TrmH family RNA methyltransferase [Candidatus Saccharimonadales bacterium]